MGRPKRSPRKGDRISSRWSCSLDRSGGACQRHFEEAVPRGTRRTPPRLLPQALPLGRLASGRGDRKHRSQCLRSEFYRANPFSFRTALHWQMMVHLKVEAAAAAVGVAGTVQAEVPR